MTKLSTPRIFLVRMLVFLVLCALVTVVLYKQIVVAFFANPGLNALIGAVLLIGTILSFRQVIRLYPEVAWVNNFRIADPGLAVERHPTLLAPMAAILGGERTGRMSISQQTMRHLLDSIATRLDEARDISRYMTGLLVFLGLLGTFWGLIETVGSVGKVIDGLKVGGDAGALFDTLKEGLAAPLGGMGISFSSSLFGLAGSLILGFLDLQSSQAQNRFYTDLEDWLASTVREYSGEGRWRRRPGGELQDAVERLRLTGRRRRQPRHHGGDGQSRRSHSGPGRAYANRAADDPRMGRRPGRAEPRNQETAGAARPPAGEELGRLQAFSSEAAYAVLARRSMLRSGERRIETVPALRLLKQRTACRDSDKRRISMALARARRSESGFNYWPGFVDALSTLVLSIVFLLSVFLVVQFFLSQEVTGKDKALEQLNAKIAQLNELLSLEKLGKISLDDEVSQLRAGLAVGRIRARPRQGPL